MDHLLHANPGFYPGRVAVFVDAGYFLYQTARALGGETRGDALIIPNKMREVLLNVIAKYFPGMSLLRIYWYDGVSRTMPATSMHEEIARLDDFKMRYGTMNNQGQQKGVDGLIMSDLISLATNRAIVSALLISGDADLSPGVAAAQLLGVRVHRLEMFDSGATSYNLQQEMDANHFLGADEIQKFAYRNRLRVLDMPTLTKDPEADAEQKQAAPYLDDIVQDFLETLSAEQKATISEDYIPQDMDKDLLVFARNAMGVHTIDDITRKRLRVLVKDLVKDSGQTSELQ